MRHGARGGAREERGERGDKNGGPWSVRGLFYHPQSTIHNPHLRSVPRCAHLSSPPFAPSPRGIPETSAPERVLILGEEPKMKRIIITIAVMGLMITGLSAERVSERERKRPGGGMVRRRPEHVKINRDIVYARVDGKELLLDVYLPKKNPGRRMPVVVWIHGGGWRGGSKGSGARIIPLVENGYIGVSINYRLSHEATWPAQIHDCKAAIRWIRANTKWYNFDPDRIGVWGSSAGGHLVAMLGTSGGVKELEGELGNAECSSRVQAVCDFFGPSDLLRIREPSGSESRVNRRTANSPVAKLLGGPVQEMKEKARSASPVNYVSRDDPPFLIVHGTRDNVVLFGQSEILMKALKKAGVEVTLKPIEGAGHGWRGIGNTTEDVIKFFDKHLKGKKASSSASSKRRKKAD